MHLNVHTLESLQRIGSEQALINLCMPTNLFDWVHPIYACMYDAFVHAACDACTHVPINSHFINLLLSSTSFTQPMISCLAWIYFLYIYVKINLFKIESKSVHDFCTGWMLFVFVSMHICIYVSFFLDVCLLACMFVCMEVFLYHYVFPSCLPVFPSACLFIYSFMPIYVCVLLYVYVNMYMLRLLESWFLDQSKSINKHGGMDV